MKKTIRTQNILMISHLLDVTDWKYLRSSPWAASTFSSVVSTLASILQLKEGMTQNQLTKIPQVQDLGMWLRARYRRISPSSPVS